MNVKSVPAGATTDMRWATTPFYTAPKARRAHVDPETRATWMQ